MQRRFAIAIAASVTAGIIGASVLVASSVGVFTPRMNARAERTLSQVAQTKPAPAKTRIVTVYVDGPAPQATRSPDVTTPPSSAQAPVAEQPPQVTSPSATPTAHESEPSEGGSPSEADD